MQENSEKQQANKFMKIVRKFLAVLQSGGELIHSQSISIIFISRTICNIVLTNWPFHYFLFFIER